MARAVWRQDREVWVGRYRPAPGAKTAERVLTGPTGVPRKDSRGRWVRPRWVQDWIDRETRRERDEAEGRATPVAGRQRLREYVERYCDEHATRRRPGSTAVLREAARSVLAHAEAAGLEWLDQWRPEHSRAWLASERRARGAGTVRTRRGYVVAVWNQAVGDGVLASSPWRKARVDGVPRPAPRHWTAEEVRRLRAAVVRSPWLRDLVTVLVHTGLRVGSALRLRWDWIDLPRRRITLPEGVGIKTSYACHVPDGAYDVLMRLHTASSGEGLVWPTKTGRPRTVAYVRKILQPAARRARVPWHGVHGLRHTCAVLMLAGGVRINAVQAQLGHRSLQQTARYLACLPESDERLSGFRV